ncbi:MAG: hypothetical protein ACP5JJ_18860 [Anaerolineae bacterium]
MSQTIVSMGDVDQPPPNSLSTVGHKVTGELPPTQIADGWLTLDGLVSIITALQHCAVNAALEAVILAVIGFIEMSC